jgi:hypothetical protein
MLHLEDNDVTATGNGHLVDAALIGTLPAQYTDDVYILRFTSITWAALPDSEILDAGIAEETTLPLDLPKIKLLLLQYPLEYKKSTHKLPSLREDLTESILSSRLR